MSAISTVRTIDPTEAAGFIIRGGVVAFPTETVYGLGASIFDETAVRKIFEAKGRPSDNPLIAHIGNVGQVELLALRLNPDAEKLMKHFFPGPLTIVVKKASAVPTSATAGLDTIGIRMPKSEHALAFLRECGTPIVAPSANISGRPSPTTWQAVRADLDGRIGCILMGDASQVGLESTVVDCTGRAPVVLRAGAITLEHLRAFLPDTTLLDPGQQSAPKSPGLKYRHYSPRARVVLCNYPQYTVAVGDSAYIGLEAPPRVESFKRHLICRDIEEYAHALFRFFRECDAEGVETIFCQTVNDEGLGLALMDRLHRAAHS